MINSLDILEKIKTRLFCNVCKQWVIAEGGEDYLPKHENLKKKKDCSNAGYSPDKIEYFVKTPKQATALAKFIKEDEGECLDGIELHSTNCGDGEDCEKTRLLLSKALAEYFLAHAS